MKTLVLASKNRGKIREIEEMLRGLPWEIKSLYDYPDCPEPAETGETFLANALIKARTVSRHTSEVVLADDSGLEVDALGGEPGVRSARYAGEGASDDENNDKLLRVMSDVPEGQRGAAFRCVLVLYHPRGDYVTFEGTWRGVIASSPAGTEGFGYDPLFYLPERGLTVAQLTPEEKNRLSHRSQAVGRLRKYLQSLDPDP